MVERGAGQSREAPGDCKDITLNGNSSIGRLFMNMRGCVQFSDEWSKQGGTSENRKVGKEVEGSNLQDRGFKSVVALIVLPALSQLGFLGDFRVKR